MIFVHGFVHCDPHPGNVLVRQSEGGPEILLLDHGLYQELTDNFRLNYCHLWQALLAADMAGVRRYSQRLGAGDLYPLFACMLTARSWDSVSRGIDRGPVSAAEAQEIRSNAAAYLPQISQLLASVPRQMLLLLKTNDLLRGIETALHTNASASSFLSMSRCCIRAVARHRRQTATSFWSSAHISISESLHLGQLRLYELLLRARTSWLQRWLTLLVHWISYSIWTSPGDLQPTEGLAGA
ncbi:aarF domain-containing protein kinase 1 [Bufo gargarizans]|uniref:aarF domain-containing protein kinase 1 n=1 Tax=Bufo gargarizans TaxID=30331 RepID=UPI001CF44F2A|nr:aarF domain-containing protein kinase 1 [Bufo gargarizans]